MSNGTHDIGSVLNNQLKSGIIFFVKSTRYQSIMAQMLKRQMLNFQLQLKFWQLKKFLD
jgi:hypothetical protein